MTEGHNITGFKPSGGGFGTRKGQSAYANNDPEIFELDKLHIQKIEPSTTEVGLIILLKHWIKHRRFVGNLFRKSSRTMFFK